MVVSLKIQLQEGRKLVRRPVVYQETRVEKDDARVVDRTDASFASDLCVCDTNSMVFDKEMAYKREAISRRRNARDERWDVVLDLDVKWKQRLKTKIIVKEISVT